MKEKEPQTEFDKFTETKYANILSSINVHLMGYYTRDELLLIVEEMKKQKE